MRLTRTRESSKSSSSSSNVHQKTAEVIRIDAQVETWAVACLVDGKHIVSGGEEGKIRRWRIEDGQEVGTPMDAKSPVLDIAVSQDGKWVVSGARSGSVAVWSAKSHSKVTEFKAHDSAVCAVDVSPDATKIATGSDDNTACVWSVAGERLLGPFKHNDSVIGFKFSPDGRLIAAATVFRDSVRIYDSQNGRLLVDFPIQVSSDLNRSLAWASDNNQLFVLSLDGNIHSLDVFTGKTRSRWPVSSAGDVKSIALASNGTFIAASTSSSISLWDTPTHKKIDCAIQHTSFFGSMALSSNYDLVTVARNVITIGKLCDVLPSRYCDIVSSFSSDVH